MFLQRLKGVPASQVINAQIDAWGGRRFLMCMLVQLSANVLCWWKKIDGGEYVAIVLGITGTYVAGNTFQKREEIKANVNPEATKQLGEGTRTTVESSTLPK
jgi:hypothetical protein